MKRAALAALAVSTALFQCNVYAQDKGEAAAKAAGCLNCHAVDAKKVGPAYKAVAAAHKGQSADQLVAAMKAKPVHQASLKSAKDEDLKAIASWILSRG